jgi:hypothetical protein
MTLQKLFRDYSLTITLLLLFLLSWLGQAYFQYQDEVSEALTHEETLETGDYINAFLAATFENWQSEFLQLGTMVVLTSMLSHKGSPESKSSEEENQRNFQRIEDKIDKLLQSKQTTSRRKKK